MTQTTENIATEPSEINNSNPIKRGFKLFQPGFINNNIFFILYLALLAIVYIAYGHWTDKTLRKINKSERLLKELQYEYKTTKTELMQQSKQQEVVKAVAKNGLQISNEVPKRINTKQ